METGRTGMAYPPVVVFSPEPWDGPWTSRHRIATGLAARGWPTLYTSGPLSLWDRHSERWRAARLLGATSPEKGLLVDRPGRLESYWPRSRIWQRMATRHHAARMRRAARRMGGASTPLAAFLFHPRYWPGAEALGPDRIVYFTYDALSLSPGWDEIQADFERQLVARADLIAAYSSAMFDYMPERARRIGQEMPTGVDLDHFDGAHEKPCPPDLAGIPEPRIGYTGQINHKLDFHLMIEVARHSPDLNFVFVGPAGPGNGGAFPGHPEHSEAWARFASLPNVYHLGPKAFADVPAYMAHMNVNIMCYRLKGGWWQAGYPLKMHEYLAIGKPVVSTGLQSILPFGDVIDIVSDAEAWTSALARALGRDGVGTPETRRATARANSWDARLDRLSGWMEDVFARRNGSTSR